jgi:hypothetical protein
MPSFCASAAAADASPAVLPLLPVALEPDELELDAPEVPAVDVLPDELLPAVETLEVPVLVLSVEVPPQALKQRQAATAAARSSER